MDFKLPRKFSCAARDVTVLPVKHFDSEDRIGDFNSALNRVRILTAGQSLDAQLQTFWHEAVHCILETAGHHNISEDEDFVERVSQLLYQVVKTAE